MQLVEISSLSDHRRQKINSQQGKSLPPNWCDGCQVGVTIYIGDEQKVHTRITDIRDLLQDITKGKTRDETVPPNCSMCADNTLVELKEKQGDISPEDLQKTASLEGGDPEDIVLESK